VPVAPTQSVTLSEDGSGALRADLRLVTGGRTQLTLAGASGVGGGNPGMYAWQERPAFSEAYHKPSPPGVGAGATAGPSAIIALPGGGVGAAFIQIPFSAVFDDDDGLGGESPPQMSGTAGQVTVWTPGLWRFGCHAHLGDSSGPTGNAWAVTPNGVQSAIRVNTAAFSGSVGSVLYHPEIPVAPAYGKWPFLFGCTYACSGLWQMARGETATIGMRALADGGTTGVVVAAATATDAFPWISTFWAYLAKPQ